MTTPASRLVSLDAFRGFAIGAMVLVNNPGDWSALYPQLAHALRQLLYAPIQALPLAAQNASLLWALLFNATMFALAWWLWSKRWFIKA